MKFDWKYFDVKKILLYCIHYEYHNHVLFLQYFTYQEFVSTTLFTVMFRNCCKHENVGSFLDATINDAI